MKKMLLLALLLTTKAFSAWPHEDISQAVFAKSVKDRTPVDIITETDDSLKKVYFFTNIRNSSGDKITHRWSHKGKAKAEVSFDIKGDRWRVWSSKNLWHTQKRGWKVEVLNRHGQILLTKKF